MPPKPDLDNVRNKLRRGPQGDWEGAGLVVLPKESGRGPLRNARPRPAWAPPGDVSKPGAGDDPPVAELDATAARLQGHGVKVL